MFSGFFLIDCSQETHQPSVPRILFLRLHISSEDFYSTVFVFCILDSLKRLDHLLRINLFSQGTTSPVFCPSGREMIKTSICSVFYIPGTLVLCWSFVFRSPSIPSIPRVLFPGSHLLVSVGQLRSIFLVS